MTSAAEGGARGRPAHRERDGGAATLWMLGALAVVALVAAGAVLRGSAVLARHRAEAAADLSALAAAGRIGIDATSCAAATAVAAANGATVLACTVSTGYDARSGTVLVRVRVPVRLFAGVTTSVTASALAGRGVVPRVPAMPYSRPPPRVWHDCAVLVTGC